MSKDHKPLDFTGDREALLERAFEAEDGCVSAGGMVHDIEVLKLYAKSLPVIRKIARRVGYAIGVHGSMKRDMDLIAVPWTRGAGPPEVLAEAIRKEVGGYMGDHLKSKPGEKPHGRMAYTIIFEIGKPEFIDLSITPWTDYPPVKPPTPPIKHRAS